MHQFYFIMNILIKNATIIDPNSPFNNQKKDLFIKNGLIIDIQDNLNIENIQIIQEKEVYISPGFFDLYAHFNEPGYEYREDLQSGSNAALKGGYTDVCVIPNTNPIMDNKSIVSYILNKSTQLKINIHPIAAVSKECKGIDLAEMYDLFNAGAIAFSDGTNPIQSLQFLSKSLQYIKPLHSIIIQTPFDKGLAMQGFMHEGIQSTKLGLLGIPAIAEEIMIARDIEILAYTNSRLHINCVSTAKGVELIKKAKENGLQITCSVSPFHLLFDESDIKNYENNLKVIQPLRTLEDKLALRKAVLNNEIDCIASNHFPIHLDEKNSDFANALFGMNTIEYCFAAVLESIPTLTLNQIVQLFSINPRKILNQPINSINLNNKASCTLYSLNKKTNIHSNSMQSKSNNIPFDNLVLQGAILGVINKNYVSLNKF